MVVECSATVAERARVSVKDTGAGLPPEKLLQLFQPFNRLGQESGGQEGTGIGLALCRKVIERHGGQIWVESELGCGAAFKFTLPSQNVINTI